MWPILLANLIFIVRGPFISLLTLYIYFKEGVNLWKLFPEPLHTLQCIKRCQRVARNCRHTGWGVKRKELTGGWRKMHHEKLMIFTPSWTLLGRWNHGIWNMRNPYENFGGYPCMKLWIHRQRWKDKINMDFKETRWKVWNSPYSVH
jgi:hypothetical protein